MGAFKKLGLFGNYELAYVSYLLNTLYILNYLELRKKHFLKTNCFFEQKSSIIMKL